MNRLYELVAALKNSMKAMIERDREIQKALITREQYWIRNEYARLNEFRRIENESRWLENPDRVMWEYLELEHIDLWVDDEVDEEMGPSPLIGWPEIKKRWFDLQDRAEALMRKWIQEDAECEGIFVQLCHSLQQRSYRDCQTISQDWSYFFRKLYGIFRQCFGNAEADVVKDTRYAMERQKLTSRIKEIKRMLEAIDAHSDVQISDFKSLHTREGKRYALNRYLKRWNGKTRPQEPALNGSLSAGTTRDLIKMVRQTISRWSEEEDFKLVGKTRYRKRRVQQV